jgi:hypothetical protein
MQATILTTEIDSDRVRANTGPEVLEKIDARIEQKIRYYASQPKSVISERIAQLEREWDVERLLEANASSLALTSLVLGLTVNKKWLVLSGGIMGFLLLHALQGWCPPIPLIRRLGVRTRGEIDREKFALKILRGDFQSVATDPEVLKHSPADDVVQAVKQ